VSAAAERTRALALAVRERGLDALLVATPVNLRYLTGFTGSNGLALIVATVARPAVHRFVTDFRYATQAAEQVPRSFEREIVTDDLLRAAAGALPARTGRLGFDEASLSVRDHSHLHELLGEDWELVPSAGIVEDMRAVKDEGELARIRAASELADEALASVLEAGVVGRSEREVAFELEVRMRRLGAEGVSFPPIVAFGAHAALPHAEPRDERIPTDVLLLIDWGALLEGYCSDCTRTFATGEAISTQARELYELVRSAQERALAAVRAGPTGPELDAVARAVIEAGGHGEQFGHGLGHGVGLRVHEAPRLSRTAGAQPIRAGNVVTVEPGVYLPGVLGVRIEDLVVVREGGSEVFTSHPKALTVIS
jgi:Xaa-Pro aminopeptidase